MTMPWKRIDSLTRIICLVLGIAGVVTSNKMFCLAGDIAKSGKRMGPVIHRYQTLGLLSCLKECLLRRSCSFVNYDSNNLLCELLYQKTTYDVYEDGYFKYYAKSDVKGKIPIGICNDTLCTEGQRCTVTKKSYVCVQTECPPFKHAAFVPKSRLLDTMEMGSEIRMLCSNEKNVSQEGTFRCDQNGTWESINHAVQKCRCIQVDKFHLNTDKFSNDCYQYVEQAKTKDLAEGFCRNQTFGGHLVFPFTASSKSFACGLVSKDEAVWVGGEWTNIHTINTSLGNISAKSVTGLSSFKGSGCLALNCMSQTMTVQNCGRSLPFMCGIEAVETP